MSATSPPALLETLPTWAMVGIVLIGIVTILPLGAAVLFIGTWVGRVDTKATSAEKAAELARQQAHDLSNQLAAYKVEAANNFVSHGALEKVEGRLMVALGELGKRLDRLFTAAPNGAGGAG